jgi:hypothetical protein
MTITSKRAAFAAVAVICVTTACDVPVLPQWDTNWYVPLPSTAMALPPGPIPNGASANVSFPTQQQSLDESIGSLLKNAADTGSVILTLSKTLNLSGVDTLFISASSAGLDVPGAGRILIPVSFTAADRTVVDTVSTSLALVQNTADANGDLFIRLRGSVSNNTGGTITVTTADSIKVKLALLTLIHSSTKD